LAFAVRARAWARLDAGRDLPGGCWFRVLDLGICEDVALDAMISHPMRVPGCYRG